jgi:hypothetical protein
VRPPLERGERRKPTAGCQSSGRRRRTAAAWDQSRKESQFRSSGESHPQGVFSSLFSSAHFKNCLLRCLLPSFHAVLAGGCFPPLERPAALDRCVTAAPVASRRWHCSSDGSGILWARLLKTVRRFVRFLVWTEALAGRSRCRAREAGPSPSSNARPAGSSVPVLLVLSHVDSC